MLKCVIIDDEPLAREILAGYITQHEALTLAGSFSNALEGKAFLQHQVADLLLLDIEIPEISGIDFLRSLSQPPITVFTTAFRDYAFEGYELGVIDYLLKPISYERFARAVDKVTEFLSLERHNADLELQQEIPAFIFVKSGVQKIKLSFADVSYIQGLKDYAIIHTTSGKIVTKGSVKSMQALFPETLFMRVHKSFIVAKDKIRRVERNSILIADQQIPVGRNYKAALDKLIDGY
ncbi:LytR/AlgR family response regulator transcription factor [Chitinophaga pinensis]|uniref:Two component transcriptional regulator, LytTR family n=1 Tax=Chitinophaga pinensis (strain ATCC 43595 / DSM 2588 / LMG 13176 / NBRC 15968 / NCIMB 11800 / UQM 2034) TaxID=485918 RepID=A0A979G8W4_CHIPD|nr:LytTR family DNA-binding domain-containing protein [Chitinophaga pinensis]ACU62813.1 two component transcriptional regulator, LytTR family [Chitinophaga pinensis DSM 2588]